MKRALLAAVTAASLLVTAAPVMAATSATGDSAVTADVTNTLEATFPGAYA